MEKKGSWFTELSSNKLNQGGPEGSGLKCLGAGHLWPNLVSSTIAKNEQNTHQPQPVGLKTTAHATKTSSKTFPVAQSGL